MRAIAPVAGIPPKKPAATEASPWPTSSRSAFTGPVGERDAATRADSSDSIAASAATATAGPARALMVSMLRSGMDGAGRELGSSPMAGSGSWSSAVATVTTMIAINDAGIPGLIRPSTTMMSATAAAAASGSRACDQSAARAAWKAATRALVLNPSFATPRAEGTCCRKMMMPIPTVKPSITGQGM